MAVAIRIVFEEIKNRIEIDVSGRPEGKATPAEISHAEAFVEFYGEHLAENSDSMELYEADMYKIFKRAGRTAN
ncbi:hypothetical protein HT845_002472 [Salmonella enterica]|nr:hypothetical protein [Salmonella enterica subsp. diarizonae]EAS0615662.1 hypothetical protein [Salmonella enterica subsp. enterica serovar Dahomey]EAW3044883.1 hypothetical protein [Salmonella enterica]ECD6159474.1 hypothetical protein [Salmonella enterica subsp. enterica]ECD7354591.1 hypothetical protein [Salmonella enterica subsp. enterica serovar Poano]